MNSAEQLTRGLRALGLDLPEERSERLLAYVRLMCKWNRVYNLTAVRGEASTISHHLLDSLSVLPHLRGMESLADVGSGAGLPGIPLAIARPEMTVALVESSHKKSSFLEQVRIELSLHNAEVVNDRVEAWRPERRHDGVISRAFSDLADFVSAAGHLLAPGGALLAMKGVYPYEEIERLPQGWRVREVAALEVPGLGAARHLVLIERH